VSFLFSFSSSAVSIDGLVSVPVDCGDVANAYNRTQQNNVSSDLMKNKTSKYNDSNAVGEYHTIDTDNWEEIECHIIDEKRIGVGRSQGNKDAIVFLQVIDNGRTDECNNYKMFHKMDWIEYRKERGENKHKRPKISENGVIWIGDTKDVYGFRVFIPVVKN